MIKGTSLDNIIIIIHVHVYSLGFWLGGHYLRSLSSELYYSPTHTAIKLA